jgi:hypothetical protein
VENNKIVFPHFFVVLNNIPPILLLQRKNQEALSLNWAFYLSNQKNTDIFIWIIQLCCFLLHCVPCFIKDEIPQKNARGILKPLQLSINQPQEPSGQQANGFLSQLHMV